MNLSQTHPELREAIGRFPRIPFRTAARPELDAVDHRVWNNRSNRAAWSWYLGQPAAMDAIASIQEWGPQDANRLFPVLVRRCH